MTAIDLVPTLPESAPFTPEQRAYLNGFFAGLFSRTPAPAAPPAPGKTVTPLAILFASQTGTAEALAKRVAREAGKHGFAATTQDAGQYALNQLGSEKRLLVIASTYGDGEPPDQAKAFWEKLSGPGMPSLKGMQFSVCALGDSNYPKFCAFGKALDARLEGLGAERLHPRVDCEVDLEEAFGKWMAGVFRALAGGVEEKARITAPEPTKAVANEFSRQNPFDSPLVANVPLNGPGSAKDTRHFEFSLEGSGLGYEAGDALGVIPANCPFLVREIISALRCGEAEMVPVPGGGTAPLNEALLKHCEITKIPSSLLKLYAEKTNHELFKTLTAPNVNGELTKFLSGREIIDLLVNYPEARFQAAEFVGALKKLQPRLYSISSSPLAHSGKVHLTTAIVRYESLGRARKGVCSTFLAERTPLGGRVPVFLHNNKGFRLPADSTKPVIMVGPGTGVAPFRAFLHERQLAGAKGKNWLFFGDQHAATDFLYRGELEQFTASGTLSRLTTAFSRDQADKVYVQDRMTENARELFGWLEEGASFYVCGDAKRMAKDVDEALHKVIQTAGGKTEEGAREYVAGLKQQGRYKRDVY